MKVKSESEVAQSCLTLREQLICDNGNYKMGTLTVDLFCQGSTMGKHYSVNKLKDIKGKS